MPDENVGESVVIAVNDQFASCQLETNYQTRSESAEFSRYLSSAVRVARAGALAVQV